MFTGLVEEVGTVVAYEEGTEGARIKIAAQLARNLNPGDSVSVNGVCLTVNDLADNGFHAAAMNQTLAVTTIGSLETGSLVNLETALKAGQPMGGHVVQGHVDGVGTIETVETDGFAKRLKIAIAKNLRRFTVERGSITVEGASLTVASITDNGFEVSLIPETQERTTLGHLEQGDRVNIEVDVLARYVERAIASRA